MAGSVERVRQHLASLGAEVTFREFDVSTRNSALGCSVAEIAKSVVFKGAGALVAVVSGDKRVDVRKLSAWAGRSVSVATPEEVRSLTGYPIGGVPPFPHKETVTVLPDSSLRRFEHVWAAGGAPNVVFRIRAEDLLRALGKGPIEVAERA
ncbi:MAG: YbaK/EbsC family protein [Nitrososphaerales archaeon]|nr:YbaK/EbsC family protein [Nitrososphaerales archaeon]